MSKWLICFDSQDFSGTESEKPLVLCDSLGDAMDHAKNLASKYFYPNLKLYEISNNIPLTCNYVDGKYFFQ